VNKSKFNRRAKRRNKYCLKHVVKFLAHYLDVLIRLRTNPCGEVTDFRLSLWLTVDINSVLGWLYRLYVSNIADISEAHAASIFSVEECKMGEFLCIFRKATCDGEGGVCGLSGSVESMDQKSCAKTEPALLKAADLF
jgi:hypothetical protein